ncbi:MAG: phage late control D family protein [Anaerolineales bacterium]
MPHVTLCEESTRQGGFYVPQFEVKIQGVGLPQDVLRDVIQLTYNDHLKEIDGFELTVNNWDATTQNFKYIGAENADSLEKNPLHRLFEPGNKRMVEVWMGYLGDLRLMLTGTFTTMEPNFPASGAPTLSVRGLSVPHQFRPKQYSTTWGVTPEKPQGWRDSEIAENIATLVDKDLGRKRFVDKQGNPLPIVINPNALADEAPLPYVVQKNQYDMDFLLTRARRLGYVIYERPGNPKALNPNERKHHLYFGPSDGTIPGQLDVTFRLEWGISLIDFKPTLTTANQVHSVTVKGWNSAKKETITGKANLDDKEININVDLHKVLKEGDPREEIVVDKPMHSEKEAMKVAQGLLKNRLKEMVKASGTCIGLPDLRAGRKVVIEGLGSRFSGTYFIDNSTHSINDSGYITKFNAHREQTSSRGGPK